MKIFFLSLVLASDSLSEEVFPALNLLSEDFSERQTSEQSLIAWVREKDSDARAEAILKRYFESEEPEESYRLFEVLFTVHRELKKGEIPQSGPGFIGIQMLPFAANRGGGIGQGVVVAGIIPGTPAEKGGLSVGDVILSIDGESLLEGVPSQELIRIVSSKAPGTTLELGIRRGDENLSVEVTLMNGNAVLRNDRLGLDSVIDFEKADQLLREDYLRWLLGERAKILGTGSRRLLSPDLQ